jgi:plastocyanin
VHRKLLALIAVGALIAITIAACGGDDDETTTAADEITTEQTGADETTTGGDEATGGYGAGGAGAGASGSGETVEISETEYKLDPSEVTTKAGEVTFAIRNDGSADHNLEIEGDGVEEVSDTIAGGQSTELTVDLQAGTYEMYCAIDGHKELGMQGGVTVE